MNFFTTLTATLLVSVSRTADASSLRGPPSKSTPSLRLLQDETGDFVPLACNANLNSVSCTSWTAKFGASNTHDNRLVIPCGECVNMDVEGGELTLNGGLDVIGKLVFEDDYSLDLSVTVLAVQGELEITAQKPVNGEPSIEFNMIGNNDLTFTPVDENENKCKGQSTCGTGKKAIVVAGGKLNINGLPIETPTWTSLYDATGGTFNKPTTIIVANSVKGKWVVGAELLITSHTFVWNEHQTRTITAVDDAESGYVALTLDSPIVRPTTVKESAEFAVEVALLSRNIVFKGGDDSSERHGGHFWIFHTPTVVQTIQGVDFQNMGQQGTLGRYPVHFHFCGDVPGSAVRKNTIRQSNQRCVVVHGTNQLLIEENVAYDTAGHCFMTEDGMEVQNKFLRNLGAQTKIVEVLIPASESSNNGEETDDEPATFWITNPTNTFDENVAAGSQHSGYWFEPKIRGSQADRYPDLDPQHEPLISFKDNVAHSNIGSRGGFRMYPGGYMPTTIQEMSGLKSYLNRRGIFIHKTHNLVVRDSLFADNGLGVDVDRAEGIELHDVKIIGETKSYRETRERQPAAGAVCYQGERIGLDLHTWKLHSEHGGVVFSNIAFSGFQETESCANMYSIHMDEHQLEQNQFELYTKFEGVTIEEGANTIDFCHADAAGIVTIYLVDSDGKLAPSTVSTGGRASVLLSDGTEVLKFVDQTKCTAVEAGCYNYCKDTCFRSVRYTLEDDNRNKNLSLKVCKIGTTEGCALFAWSMRGDGDPMTFIAHVPVGHSYVAVFMDNMGNELMPEQVEESFEDSFCPNSAEFGFNLVASLPAAAPVASPVAVPTATNPVAAPAAAPAAPVAAPVGTTDTSDSNCFSGYNTVEIMGDGEELKLMEDLRIGDYVRTASGKFSQVYSFSHIDNEAKVTYLQITARGLDNPIEISHNHMLFVGGMPVRAKDVKVGDMLGQNMVTAVKNIERFGLYAPVTSSGDIVVSGVAASCFVALLDLPAPIQHAAAQAVHSPLRLACSGHFAICQFETYTTGYSYFVWNIIQLAQAVQAYPVAIQLAVVFAASPFLVAVSMIEQAVMTPLLAKTVFVLAFFFQCQKRKSKTKNV